MQDFQTHCNGVILPTYIFHSANKNKIGKRSVRSLPKRSIKLRKKMSKIPQLKLSSQSNKQRMPKPNIPLASKLDKESNEKIDPIQKDPTNDWDDVDWLEDSEEEILQYPRIKRNANDKDTTKDEHTNIATSPGAGQQMGLSVVLNSDKTRYFMTSAFFEGFKVV